MEDYKSIQERFARFDQAHTEIYEEFRAIAQDLLQHGRRYYGLDTILELICYQCTLQTQDENEVLKINSNYSFRYIRKLINETERFAYFLSFESYSTPLRFYCSWF